MPWVKCGMQYNINVNILQLDKVPGKTPEALSSVVSINWRIDNFNLKKYTVYLDPVCCRKKCEIHKRERHGPLFKVWRKRIVDWFCPMYVFDGLVDEKPKLLNSSDLGAEVEAIADEQDGIKEVMHHWSDSLLLTSAGRAWQRQRRRTSN